MDRKQFEDWMLVDQKSFAGYARLFMNSEGAQSQSFLDWCWKKYREGVQPSPNSTGYVDGNSRFSEERSLYPRI
jgi:hypothetical protein